MRAGSYATTSTSTGGRRGCPGSGRLTRGGPTMPGSGPGRAVRRSATLTAARVMLAVARPGVCERGRLGHGAPRPVDTTAPPDVVSSRGAPLSNGLAVNDLRPLLIVADR